MKQIWNAPRAGAKPLWIDRYPKIYELMKDTNVRTYQIASIIGIHPETLSKKLRCGTLSDDDVDHIIDEVKNYLDSKAIRNEAENDFVG